MRGKIRAMSYFGAAAALGLALAFTGCATTEGGSAGAEGGGAVKPAPAKAPAKAEAGWKFVCNCGPNCTCGTSADKPGNCVCGKPLAYKKILAETVSSWKVCPCRDCGCTELDPNNPALCSCGKTLKQYPRKGTYTCACSDCDCGSRADEPGNCVCGVEMIKQ